MSERNLKEQLLQILQKNHLLSVSGILEKLEKQGKTYNKTSVYRALEQLLEDNVICRHYFNEAEAVFELLDREHAHLVCSNCGKVTSCDVDLVKPTNLDGFSIEHQHVTLIGKCEKCQAKLAD